MLVDGEEGEGDENGGMRKGRKEEMARTGRKMGSRRIKKRREMEGGKETGGKQEELRA